MKKIVLVIIVVVLIGVFYGCEQSKEITVINGVDLIGEVTLENIEINSSKEEGIVSPGQNIVFSVKESYRDEEGNTAQNDTEQYTVTVEPTEIVEVNNNKSIIVPKDAIHGQHFTVTVVHSASTHTFEYSIEKNIETTVDANSVILSPDDIDVLVNKERRLPSDYIPKDLIKLSVPTCLNNPEVNQLRKVAADALKNLFAAAKEKGHNLVARSGYRSYQTQKALRHSIEQSRGIAYADKYSAQAGESEHQTGLAIDITSPRVDNQLSKDFGILPDGKWVKDNAYKYGFIIRYPEGKKDIVGYEYEPWHLRYVGKRLATLIYESGLTMEEYFE